MNKLGIQCQEKHEEVYRYNRELKPIVVKSINIVDPGHYARLAAENPGVELVYRQVPNGPWDGEGAGRRWAEHLYRLVGHIPEVTLVEGHNEWIHSPPHNTPDDYDRADRFMAALIDRVHELWGGRVHAVVLNASCGHFNEDIVDFFPRTLAKLQVCGKCLLALHEYDHPDKDMLGDGGRHLCGKFLRNLAGLKAAGYDKVRIAITECGVDSGVGAPAGSGHVGFKHWGENAAARYLNERNLGWYLPLLQKTEGVAWATIFGCGMHGEWGTFDVKDTPVVDGIGEIYKNWTPPPNGDSDVKIYDMLNQEQDIEWMHRLYGVNWERAEVAPGQKVYRLVLLREKEGPHALVSQVVNGNDQPMANVDVAFYWPSAPDPPDPPTEVYPHDWHRNFVHGPTNVNGDVGPGMGPGAYHGLGECGPHQVWVRDPDIPSDRCYCLGMLAGTNHRHMDQRFQLMAAGEEEPPVNGELLEEVKKIGIDVAAIRRVVEQGQPPGPPPTDAPFRGEYFNNTTLSGTPVLVRDDQEINFRWGEDIPPGPGVPTDNFSVRWTGDRTFEAGTYRFSAFTDDGVRVWVSGQLIIDQWTDHAPTQYDVSIALTAGQHSIKMEYYERGGGATAMLWWNKLSALGRLSQTIRS